VSQIGDGIREFIEANQYDYTDVGNDCYRLRFNGKNGDYNMFAQGTDEPCHVMVFTYCPVKVPEDRRGLVADYINRVNYGLILGCLEMDPDDGEVRARSAAPVGVAEPGPSLLGPLFDSSYYLMDNWLPGLLRVAFGSEDPATAYAARLEALQGQQTDPGATDEENVSTGDDHVERELTPIEQEVSRLLAERDGDPEPA
jgi:hypothetical protein